MLGCLVDGATCDDRDGSKAVEVARHLAKSSKSPRNHNLHAAARFAWTFPRRARATSANLLVFVTEGAVGRAASALATMPLADVLDRHYSKPEA